MKLPLIRCASGGTVHLPRETPPGRIHTPLFRLAPPLPTSYCGNSTHTSRAAGQPSRTAANARTPHHVSKHRILGICSPCSRDRRTDPPTTCVLKRSRLTHAHLFQMMLSLSTSSASPCSTCEKEPTDSGRAVVLNASLLQPGNGLLGCGVGGVTSGHPECQSSRNEITAEAGLRRESQHMGGTLPRQCGRPRPLSLAPAPTGMHPHR